MNDPLGLIASAVIVLAWWEFYEMLAARPPRRVGRVFWRVFALLVIEILPTILLALWLRYS